MQTIPLDKARHDRVRFDCGEQALNLFLAHMAHQQSLKDNSRTYVLEDPHNPKAIVGFYTLAMIHVDLGRLPETYRKKHRQNSTAGLVARLAVDKRFVGRGIGGWLLVDALKRLLDASESVGFPMVIVEAKEDAVDFYRRFGFAPFVSEPNTLYMTVADIRASIG